MRKAVFQLEPLTCPSCVKKIETAVGKVAGVESTKVLFNAGKVKVDFNEEMVQANEVENVIQSLGFPVQDRKIK